MHEYRVTKYDPQHRKHGAYTRDEWTSVSDVGKVFGGILLTMEAYEQAERQHLHFLSELAQQCSAFPLYVDSYDDVHHNHAWHEGQEIPAADLQTIVRSILREECWCRLHGTGFFIHFGYDYYIYVGCHLPLEAIRPLAARHGLFCEPFRSPYHDEEEAE